MTTKKSKKSSGGRGSAEAIEKRRVARQLNALLTGATGKKTKLDGRTEKRRQRLIKELKSGKGGKPLKPHDVLQHAHELLEIGETMASLRKQGVKPRRIDLSEEILEVIKRHASAFQFRPEAWRMLGLKVDSKGELVSSKRKPRKSSKKKPRA